MEVNGNSIFILNVKYLIASNITNSNGKILFSRDLDYGFAITSHRAQGSTYRNVFVDINDMIYDKYGHPYTNRDEMSSYDICCLFSC